MAQVFYDPANSNQVMAVYQGCRYGGKVWQDRGFIEIEAPDGVTRDHRLIVSDGVVTGIVPAQNLEQPAPSPLAPPSAQEVELRALADKLGVTITDTDRDAARDKIVRERGR